MYDICNGIIRSVYVYLVDLYFAFRNLPVSISGKSNRRKR